MIKIDYDGEYPNLCRGNLKVTIKGKEWVFPWGCLCSGGSAFINEEGNEEVEEGPWSIVEWPEGFPLEDQNLVEDAVNNEIQWGCCGGCL